MAGVVNIHIKKRYTASISSHAMCQISTLLDQIGDVGRGLWRGGEGYCRVADDRIPDVADGFGIGWLCVSDHEEALTVWR